MPETAGNPPVASPPPAKILKALSLRDPGPGSSCGFSSEMGQNRGCEALEPSGPELDPKLSHLLTIKPQAKEQHSRDWGYSQLDLPSFSYPLLVPQSPPPKAPCVSSKKVLGDN